MVKKGFMKHADGSVMKIDSPAHKKYMLKLRLAGKTSKKGYS